MQITYDVKRLRTERESKGGDEKGKNKNIERKKMLQFYIPREEKTDYL